MHRTKSTGTFDKERSMLLRNVQFNRQQPSQLLGWTACVGLDLLDRVKRTMQTLSHFGLGEIKRLAATPDPGSKRIILIFWHKFCAPNCTRTVYPLQHAKWFNRLIQTGGCYEPFLNGSYWKRTTKKLDSGRVT